MNLIEVNTNRNVKAKIRRLRDTVAIEIEANFSFNWELEESNELFNLTQSVGNEIIGLISITTIAEELRIHINLIESSIHNRGESKIIKNIAHCLISYACKQSFALGYDGFVSLYPKTELIDYYINEFGFEQFGRHLAVYGKNSYVLINKYLDEK